MQRKLLAKLFQMLGVAAERVIVKGTSAEVKAAAEAEAARAGEDWAQLSWQRRQKLCASAAATVLQAKIDAGPEHTQALCRNLRALEPVEAVATTSATSPPFPRLGLSLAFLLLMAPLVPEGATTAEACFYLFMSLTPRALSSVADGLVRLNACDPATGLPYAATATVFASHAWKYDFALLLAALAAFVNTQPDPSRVYIWFDCAVR